jgi:hypothetical protein
LKHLVSVAPRAPPPRRRCLGYLRTVIGLTTVGADVRRATLGSGLVLAAAVATDSTTLVAGSPVVCHATPRADHGRSDVIEERWSDGGFFSNILCGIGMPLCHIGIAPTAPAMAQPATPRGPDDVNVVIIMILPSK